MLCQVALVNNLCFFEGRCPKELEALKITMVAN